MTNPIYPFPEAIERKDVEGQFDIEAGYQSSVNLTKRKMVVRTDGACVDCGLDHARATRLREMGHIAWTPADWEKRVKRTKDRVPVGLVEKCEEARINTKRKRNDLEIAPPIYCDATEDYYFLVRQLVKSGDMVSLAGLIAASVNTEDEVGFSNAVKRLFDEAQNKDEVEQVKAQFLLDLANQIGHHARFHFYGNATFRYTIALARDILALVERSTTSMERKLREMEDAKREAEGKTKITPYKSKADRLGKKGKGSVPEERTRGYFGTMDIVRLPLPYRSKAGFERRWTARDEGPIPVRFDRWSIDKRVFRAKKRGKGAALLVDVSGSMGWDDEDLTRVLEEVPAATIAVYSGSGDRGELVIVAKNGRCASMRQAANHMLGGNIIDGPALEWLAEQSETTKLWMSDGGITGVGDGYVNEDGAAFVNYVLRRGGIQQVRNSEEVMEVLTGKRPFTPTKKVMRRW